MSVIDPPGGVFRYPLVDAIRGKLLPAFLLAALTVGLGGRFQVLPGLRVDH